MEIVVLAIFPLTIIFCGQTPDISCMLCSQFYEPVHYSDINSFQVRSPPMLGAQCWDTLTFHILTDDTHHITYQSAAHSVLNQKEKKFAEGEDGL